MALGRLSFFIWKMRIRSLYLIQTVKQQTSNKEDSVSYLLMTRFYGLRVIFCFATITLKLKLYWPWQTLKKARVTLHKMKYFYFLNFELHPGKEWWNPTQMPKYQLTTFSYRNSKNLTCDNLNYLFLTLTYLHHWEMLHTVSKVLV